MTPIAMSLEVVRDDDGRISIVPSRGTGSPDEVFESRTPVHGGSLAVAVDDPGLDLSARIDDVDDALWWVEHVFGPHVADAVVELAESSDAATREVRGELGELADVVRRLLLGRWLSRWIPPVRGIVAPEWALEAELGGLAWTAEEVFGGSSGAREHLEHEWVVDAIAHALEELVADPAVRRDDPIPAAIALAGRAAVDVLEPDMAGFERLERAYLALQADERSGGTLRRAVEWLDGLRDRVGDAITDAIGRAPALVASGERRPISDGQALLDWREVHPRSVAPGDPARWTLLADDGLPLVRVEVDRSGGSRDDEGVLFARVRAPGSATLGIALDAEGSRYVGEGYLPSDVDPRHLEVQVYSERYGTGRRGFADADQVRRIKQQVMSFLEARADDRHAGRLDGASAEFAFEALMDELSA